jgi:catalase
MIKRILKTTFRWLGRLLLLILAIAAVKLIIYYFTERNYQANIPMGEVIGPDEDAVMAGAIAMALNMINKTRDDLIEDGITGDSTYVGTDYEKTHETSDGRGGPVTYRRDVHIKSHGCVKADFTVLELDSKYRWGVFSEAKTFEAWIRYSNGDFILNPDTVRDARGMAIKLMGVDGKKLLPGQTHALTQDFVLMNATNYFIRELADYVELTKYLALGDNFGYFLNGWSKNPLSWRWRELILVAGTKKKPPESPLLTQYFSASAYKLGPDNNIKFSARPRQCQDTEGNDVKTMDSDWVTSKDNYNFLRLRMVEQLTAGPACFDFMVQLQVPGKIMPVEDATIVWSEKDSPFVTVAHVEIPQQQFNNEQQNQFCENLSMNPWHSLAEHRPTGVFNRVRKALYEEVAKYRWNANQQQYGNPGLKELTDGQPPEPTAN